MPRKKTKSPVAGDSQVISGFRLRTSLVARLDAFVEAKGKTGWPVTRNEVMRQALAAGLDVLEKRERDGGGE
jgi:hypothetical protein